MVLHGRAGDLELKLWLGVVKELAPDIVIGTSLINGFSEGVFAFLRRLASREATLVYISAIARDKEESTTFAVTNDMLTVTESLFQDEPRVVRQTVTAPKP